MSRDKSRTDQPNSPVVRERGCVGVRSGHEVREHFDVAARHSVAGSPSLPVHRRSVGGVSPREKIIGSRASPAAVASKAQVGDVASSFADAQKSELARGV